MVKSVMPGTMKTMSLFALAALLLMADKANSSIVPAQTDSQIPNVPNFSITYEGEALTCSPTGLIKKKSHKDLVTYQCQGKYTGYMKKPREEAQQGNEETERLANATKQKIAQGAKYTVNIPLHDASRPARARFIARQQLHGRPYGKYLRMLLPATIYLSIRPQLANTGNDSKMKLRNAGSRGGFFYFHQFSNDLQLMFQYEAKVNLESDTPFINVSNASDSSRRLSYFALKHESNSIILGKYWSAYYDIAGFTDHYMAYGAQSSGAYNAGTDGAPSGTGRPELMLQARRTNGTYDAAIQMQFRHDALRNFDTDYRYTMAGSLIYKGLDNFRIGASIDYGKFDEITSQMQAVGIDGNDFSSIAGISYNKNNYGINAVLSYTKNHMNDDQGSYFDGVGAELYMYYDIDGSYRLAGGGNWLVPRDDNYRGQYSIRDLIFSLQYTFGEKTFDDLVYLEVSLPNGKLANGDSREASVAIGLRYLIGK